MLLVFGMQHAKEILQAAFLGILQGATEFLPVSSSGHLVIAQHFLPDVAKQPVTLDIILHLGTLFALCIYFFKDLKNMLFAPKIAMPLVVATLATVMVAFPFRHYIESAFSSPQLASLILIFTGLLLFIAAKVKRNYRQSVGIRDAIYIGLSQALATLPGVSRSGTTIAFGIYLGLKGETSCRFSFLMAIPAIFGAGLLELKGISSVPHTLFLPYLVGFICSFLIGLWAIKFLLKMLIKSQKKLSYFAYYCWVTGLVFFWLI